MNILASHNHYYYFGDVTCRKEWLGLKNLQQYECILCRHHYYYHRNILASKGS